jgi:glycosyltransferase involved in cell wall biosynthesis
MPQISILLPIKNGAMHLHQCLESILNQSYRDYELLIFDDDSQDNTLEILRSYSDVRIKVFSGKLGFVENLNKGIQLAAGKYIARMDADDIMITSRLEVQFQRMESLKVDVCASWLYMFGAYTESYIKTYELQGFLKNPLNELAKNNCIAHPSVMIRKAFLEKHELKYQNYPFTEDYKLWFEIAKRGGIFYIEPQPLLRYRISSEQVSITNESKMNEAAARVQAEILTFLAIKS